MSPPRPASGATYALCNDNTFIKGHYLTPDAVMDLKEALSLRALEEDDLERRADTAAEEEEEEEEALSESDAASVDSLLAREIVEPFEFDILRTDA
jgi:hypothetical protein